LDCVVYLYASVEDARQARKAGGSGFLISVPLEDLPDRSVKYLVTNSHVAVSAGAVRLNTHDGASDVIPVSAEQWSHHPAGDDVAVLPIPLSPAHFRYKTLPTSYFLTQEDMEKENVGPGDDVYFMGRFIAHDGTQRNQPVVRFGSIAMMPGEPVYQKERAFQQESFLIEARSLSGFSGSPVMLYIPPFSNRFLDGTFGPDSKGLSPSTTTALLGIDWGNMHLADETLTNSGIMAAVPVWKLVELLDDEAVVVTRRELAEAIQK
jgi:hypothetical protein